MSAPLQPWRRARGARRRLFLGLALGLCSCDPGELDLTGKLCSAERPCPSGWECVSGGTCRREGTGNRLANGGFESGVAGWTVSHGTLAPSTPGRSSDAGAQWSTDGAAESVVTLVAPAVDDAASGWWCAEAWVRGTDGLEVGFELLDDGERADYGTVRAAGGVWARVEARTLSVDPRPMSVALRSPADAGVRQVYLDDVAIWHDASSNVCASPP